MQEAALRGSPKMPDLEDVRQLESWRTGEGLDGRIKVIGCACYPNLPGTYCIGP